jgi:hypothetical protein
VGEAALKVVLRGQLAHRKSSGDSKRDPRTLFMQGSNKNSALDIQVQCKPVSPKFILLPDT